MRRQWPAGKKSGPALAQALDALRRLQPSPLPPRTLASYPPRALVTCSLFGRFVVQYDECVDGNAGPRIDLEWIDVDRGDPVSRIRHQVGQAYKRFYDRGFMHRGPAAITPKFHASLGAADQRFGFSCIERRAGKRNILHQLLVDAADPEQHGRP